MKNCKECWWYGKPIKCPANFNINTKECKKFKIKINRPTECNCCVCEPVCKYKEVYLNGIVAILNATVSIKREDGKVGFMKVKDCPHIEVSIKCPHMITQSGTISADIANVNYVYQKKNLNPELLKGDIK